MASGSFLGTTNSSYIIPRILWSSSPNSTTNKSDVTVTFQLMKSSSSTSKTYGTGSWVLTIGDATYNMSEYITLSPNNTYVTIFTKTISNIQHDTNGAKSLFIGVTGGISGTTYSSTAISKTISLDTIARASTITSCSFTNGYIDQGLDLVISSKESTYYHDVTLYVPDTSGAAITLANVSLGRKQGGTHHFNFTAAQLTSIYAKIPKTNSSFTIKVQTYNGNTGGAATIGDPINKAVIGNIPIDLGPTIGSLTATVVDGLNGLYVQGKSKVSLSCNATMASGATATSYAFSGQNMSVTGTSSSATSNIIIKDGTQTYTVIVTDSRGRFAVKSVNITVYPYAAPTIDVFTVQRCNSSGTLTTDGTYARISVTTSHSPVNANNTASVTLSYVVDGNTVTQPIISASTTAFNTYTGTYGGSFNISTKYPLTVTIADKYTYTSSTVDLGSAQRCFNVAKYNNGIAIGGLSTVTTKTAAGAFECNWDASFAKDVKVTGAETVDKNLTVAGSTTSGSIVSNGNTKTASLTVTGAETVGGNLSVTGSTTSGSIVSNGNTKTATLTTTGNASVGGSLSVGGTAMADFVIAQGTSGTWTYTKWNSGKLECYGNLSYSASCPANGGYAKIAFSSAWPITFSAMPAVNVTLANMTTYYQVLLDVNFGTTHFAEMVICALPLVGNVVNVTGLACVHAVGHWK